MIVTKHKIALVIDDTTYHVVVADATKSQEKELKEYAKSYDTALETFTKANSSYMTLADEYKLNKVLLEEPTLIERITIALEQKQLIKKINTAKEAIIDAGEVLNNPSVSLAQIFEKKYDLLITGADAAALKKVVLEKNVGFEKLFAEVNQVVEQVKQKK